MELLKPGRKVLMYRLFERALFLGNVGVCVVHIYKCLLSVLSQARRSPSRSSLEEHLPSFLAVTHSHIGQEEVVRKAIVPGQFCSIC